MRDEFRDLKIVQGPILLSNGSARLLGGRHYHILCSVKAEIVQPSSIRPNEGVIEINVDRQLKQQRREQEDTLKSLCETLIAEHLVDPKKLCILPHHFVWRLSIDIYLLSDFDSISIIDAVSHVMVAALRNTLLPSVTVDNGELLVDSDIRAARPPPGIDDAPIVVTVCVIKCMDPSSGMPQSVWILDASPEEEACSYAQVHVAVAKATICSLKTVGSLPLTLLPQLSAAALQAAPKAIAACRHVSSSDKTASILQAEYLLQ